MTNNETGVTLSGTLSGNGSGLTNLQATNLTGTIATAQLPASVAFLNTSQRFTGGLNTFTGNVGIGTTTPAAQAQISGNFGTNLSIGFALQGNGSGGSLMSIEQTGISAWGIGMVSNQSRLSIIDNRYPGNAGTEVVSVLTGGNVGIGTTNPAYTLQVNGSVAGVGAYQNVSDARYKTNIARLTHALDKIMALRGVEYDWRSNAKLHLATEQQSGGESGLGGDRLINQHDQRHQQYHHHATHGQFILPAGQSLKHL